MKLRPYQQTAVDWTFEYLETMKGNPCICLPTGSGKSLCLAELIRRWPKDKSVLLLSHRAEILQQNERKIRTLLPLERIGVFSATLGRKKIERVTIAQVQSFAKKVKDLHFRFDLIIIDENHLVPHEGEGQYQKIIKEHPEARIVGLTATPTRLDSGAIVGENKIFSHFSYEADIKGLIRDGYLAPLVGKSSVVQANLESVGTRGNEYILAQAMKAINQDTLTERAVEECLKYGENRKHWIVFCSGVEHAENVSRVFTSSGISNRVITGDTINMERQQYFNAFERGEIRALINIDCLTTGFDAPCIDMIVLLRATMSTSLYCQILGRGMRTHPEKTDCLVLDFAGNLEKHGPIDQIKFNTCKVKGEEGQTPGKICPTCRSLCHSAVKDCPECGFVFPENIIKHDAVASNASPLSAGAEFAIAIAKPTEIVVDKIEFQVLKSKKDGTEMLSVVYWTKYKQERVSELLFFDHQGRAFEKAQRWWRVNTLGISSGLPIPNRVFEAFARIEYEMSWPVRLWVKKTTGKYYEVVSRTNTNITVRKKKLELEEELC